MGLLGLVDVAPGISIELGLVDIGAVSLVGAGLGLLIVLAVRNFHLVGVPIIAFGLGMNLLATIANDGFPVDSGALVAARVETSNTVDEPGLSGVRRLRTDDDRLWWLGDAIPIRELEHVMSFGDLVVIAGLGCTVEHLTRRKRPHPARPLSPDARAGLASIAAPEIRLDAPTIDLALVAEAADHGYAARPDATRPDAASDKTVDIGGHDEREPGPRLGDGSEPTSSVGLPILREF
jgi:hypothetical protein